MTQRSKIISWCGLRCSCLSRCKIVEGLEEFIAVGATPLWRRLTLACHSKETLRNYEYRKAKSRRNLSPPFWCQTIKPEQNNLRDCFSQVVASESCMLTECEMMPVSPTGIETLSPSSSTALALRQLPFRRAAKSDALDPNLREMIGAWPHLPAEVRGAILVMVRAAGPR